MANKYGETGAAAALRKKYNAARGADKAAVKTDLRAARQSAGLRTQQPATNPRGFLANQPGDITSAFNEDKIDSASGALGSQQQVNQYNAYLNAQLNRPTENTPFGNQNYTIGPNGEVIRNQTLSQNQGAINSLQENLDISNLTGAQYKRDQAGESLRDPYSLNAVGAQALPTDFSADRQRVEDSLYGRFAARNEPLFQQQQSAAAQDLSNQGLMPGSKGYNDAMNRLAFQQNDARQGAMTGAVQSGLSEQQGMFGMNQQARNQGINEYEAQRYAPVQEMGMLQQGVRGFLAPNFTPMANVDVGNVDVGGTFTNYKMANKPTGMLAAPSGGGGGSQPNYGNQLIGIQNGLMGGGQWGAGGGGGQTAAAGLAGGFGSGFTAGATQPRWR